MLPLTLSSALLLRIACMRSVMSLSDTALPSAVDAAAFFAFCSRATRSSCSMQHHIAHAIQTEVLHKQGALAPLRRLYRVKPTHRNAVLSRHQLLCPAYTHDGTRSCLVMPDTEEHVLNTALTVTQYNKSHPQMMARELESSSRTQHIGHRCSANHLALFMQGKPLNTSNLQYHHPVLSDRPESIHVRRQSVA